VVVICRRGRALRRGGRPLLGQHQTVIKPLGRMFRSLRGISGSSILGSGEVALIFDVASLATWRRSRRAPGTRPPVPAPPVTPAQKERP
jgi:two-component system chemotaxis sensor kinase CheA